MKLRSKSDLNQISFTPKGVRVVKPRFNSWCAACTMHPARDEGGLVQGASRSHTRHARTFWLHIYSFMARIDDNIIRHIIDRADIVDVVSDYVKLRPSGTNLTGLCPFHDDENDGNFMVRPKSVSRYPNTWHCFVCDIGGGCVEFLQRAGNMSFPDAIRVLGKKYGIPVDDVPVDYIPPPPKPIPPPKPYMELPREWVQDTMKKNLGFLNLVQWIYSLKWDGAQQDRIKTVLWEYCVGAWKDGRVVYWYIDEKRMPRSAKLMKYLPDGHRDKTANPGWLYNQKGCVDICKPDEHTILKPLFGLHLLDRYPTADVNIVESEKTAIIMAIAYGNHERGVWMACGGLNNISREKLLPLINARRNIILYPDRDGVKAWKEKAQSIGYDLLRVNSDPVLKWWEPRDGEKADIADIIINRLNK